mgnify:CR=1 FL=1
MIVDGQMVGYYILHPNNIGRCSHVANASYVLSKEMRGGQYSGTPDIQRGRIFHDRNNSGWLSAKEWCILRYAHFVSADCEEYIKRCRNTKREKSYER